MTIALDNSLKLYLLGDFLLTNNEQPLLGMVTPRLQSLLAYLVLHQKAPQPRRQLAFRFWPDSSEVQALTNLRKQLLLLRRALSDVAYLLHTDNKTVQWQSDASFSLDVAEFEATLVSAESLESIAAIPVLQRAISIYRGDLLPDCYDDWIIPHREALRAKYTQALERLGLLQEGNGDYAAAIQSGQRLLRYDPLHESTYRRLMRLYARSGDRAAALNLYHTCVVLLRRELDVEPSADTRAVYEQLMYEDVPTTLQGQEHPFLVARAPFVGRQVEWQRLQEIWRHVRRGHTHFVLICGEAGIGKSRLAEELQGWLTSQGIKTAHARAFAAEGRLPYAPVVEWLRTPTLSTWHSALANSWLTELARLLPEVVTMRPELALPTPQIENWNRQRLFEALALATFADQQPRLLVLDDLQWCDRETLEWLHYLLRYAPQHPLLVIGTARPAEIDPQHPLLALRYALQNNQQWTEVSLTALTALDTATLAQQMAKTKLPADLTTRLYQDTEGNPLFIVETVRARIQEKRVDTEVWEREISADDRSLETSDASLPPKVRGVIESRLAQLSPHARKLVATAASIGREFTYDVLVHMSEQHENEIIQGLDELWQRQIVREQKAGMFDFSHDKLREVAYRQISATHRQLLHRRIAQALASIHEVNLDQVSSQLAAHYEKAGLAREAISGYQRAAQAALRIYANHEAIEHFHRALALIATLPESTEIRQQELSLLLGLGPALIAIKGYGFAEVYDVYTRAQSVTQQLGKPANPAILRALAIYSIARCHHKTAYAHGEQILVIASQQTETLDPVLYIEANHVMGAAAFWQSNFLRAHDHFAQAVANYDMQRHNLHITLYSQDPGVVCHARFALTLWYLGYPDQAQQQCDTALALARQFAHPLTHSYALIFVIWTAMCRRDLPMTAQLVNEAVMLFRQQNVAFWLSMARGFQGWLLAEQGQTEQGIAEIRAAIETYQSTQSVVHLPQLLLMLAQAYIRANRIESALATLNEGLSTLTHHGDRWCEAELQRCKGELLNRMALTPEMVETAFVQAYTLARQQGAKSLELRAAISLSRFWNRQGKRTQARQLLIGTFEWFTEGFETPDLQDAKVVLGELSMPQAIFGPNS